MHNGDTVRILVVDDFEPWRREVCSMLELRPQICVVAEAGDGLEAVQKAQELKPDLIFLDIGLPSLNGLEVANRIRQFIPDTRIIFLTQNRDRDVIQQALSIGAQGYVVKANAWTELLTAIDGTESHSTTA
jgi:DNA-binding NarL/FixJ family response regulator